MVGGGLSGSLAARELALSGFAVTVFDSLEPTSANATNLSGGLVRAFDIDAEQREDAASVVYGADSVRCRDSGFVRAGALTSGVAAADAHAFTTELADRYRFDASVLTAEEVRIRYGVELPADSISVLEPDAGFVSPRKLASSARRIASRSGAVMRFSSRVVSVNDVLNGVDLVVDGEREPIRFDYSVLALGAWTSKAPNGVDGIGPSAVMAIQIVYVARPTSLVHPTLFDYGSGVYAAPTSPGVSLLGLSTGTSFENLDDVQLRSIDEFHVKRTLALAAKRLPWVAAASVLRVVRGFDGVAEPGARATNAVGDNDRIVVVRPWNGTGAKHALSAAREVRDRLLHREGSGGNPLASRASPRPQGSGATLSS